MIFKKKLKVIFNFCLLYWMNSAFARPQNNVSVNKILKFTYKK